uniref:Transmembrane protein 159 n=1 Tax=Stegastes partitus TaxID=144197 RepID=A0A3B4ZS17_9TELE
LKKETNSSTETQLRQLWALLLSLPQVALVLDSRLGQYLSKHPFLAVTLVLFVAMAAVPVGLFLTFAVVTLTMSVVGFVFLEGRRAEVSADLCIVFFSAATDVLSLRQGSCCSWRRSLCCASCPASPSSPSWCPSSPTLCSSPSPAS